MRFHFPHSSVNCNIVFGRSGQIHWLLAAGLCDLYTGYLKLINPESNKRLLRSAGKRHVSARGKYPKGPWSSKGGGCNHICNPAILYNMFQFAETQIRVVLLLLLLCLVWNEPFLDVIIIMADLRTVKLCHRT